MGVRNFAEIAPNLTPSANSQFSSANGTYAFAAAGCRVENLFSSPYKENLGPQEWPSTFPPFDPQMGVGQGSGFKAAPVQFTDVNYTEGSTDKQWSRRDFSWTRELEVGCWRAHRVCFFLSVRDS